MMNVAGVSFQHGHAVVISPPAHLGWLPSVTQLRRARRCAACQSILTTTDSIPVLKAEPLSARLQDNHAPASPSAASRASSAWQCAVALLIAVFVIRLVY